MRDVLQFQPDCVASNDVPHPHMRDAFGFTTRKPAPVKTTAEIQSPRRAGRERCRHQIKNCIPSAPITSSPSSFRRGSSVMHPEQPPFAGRERESLLAISLCCESKLWSMPNRVVRDINHFPKIRLGRIQVKNGRDGRAAPSLQCKFESRCRSSKQNPNNHQSFICHSSERRIPD